MIKRHLCTFLCVAFGIVIFLGGCSVRQHAKQDTMPFAPDSTSACELRLLHRAKVGTAAYAQAESGMYMMQPRQDGSSGMNVVYLDFESAQMAVLCERPECMHNNETCTGWFSIAWGSCQSAAIGDKVYLLFSGNSSAEQPLTPQLVQIDQNGSNRKALVTFDATDSFSTPFATDEKSLFLMQKTVEQTPEATFETTTKLIEISLETGNVTVINQWNQDARLWGASQDKFFVQIPLNFDDGGYSSILMPGQGQQYKIVSVTQDGAQTDLFSAEETDCIGAAGNNSFYQITPKEHTVTARSFLENRIETVCDVLPEQLDSVFSVNVVDAYGELLFLTGMFLPDQEHPESRSVLYAIDTQAKSIVPITLYVTESGFASTKLVLPIAKYKDCFLVQNALEIKQISGIGPDGEVVQYDMMLPRFALITKQDFLQSNAVYQEIKPVNLT